MMVTSTKPIFTILVPVCNEEKVIPLFFHRMKPVLEELSLDFEPHLIFLNNASSDRTLDVIHEIRGHTPHVYVITLASQVHVNASETFGLRNSIGEYFVFIDCDLEDPPEMILDFVRKQREGYDIVYGERVDRPENRVVHACRKLFYRLLKKVADDQVILDMADFALITREVRDAIIQDTSSYPFIRTAIARVGFKRTGIPYRRSARVGGKTHYNLWGMTTFAIGGILASSTLALRAPAYLLPFWLVAMMACVGFGIAYDSMSAFTLLAFLGFSYCGSVLTFLSIYTARVYRNTLGRPNAFMNRKYSILQDGVPYSQRVELPSSPGAAYGDTPSQVM